MVEVSSAELRVSLADELHNARAMLLDLRTRGDALWGPGQAGGSASVRPYDRALLTAFHRRAATLGDGARVALDELGRTVDDMGRVAGG